MSKDCRKLYLEIQDLLKENVSKTLEPKYSQQIASAQSFIEDYKKWEEWIKRKYGTELFSLAIIEYEMTIIFCLQSLYKQAFTSMRACLEHTLFGIQLSTNLLQYIQWRSGKQDVYWSSIIDKDNGLFSKSYIDAFCPDVFETSILIGTSTKTLYRECSEYIHGNYKITNAFSEQLEFNANLVDVILDKTNNLRSIIEFSLFVRFQSEFTPDSITEFEPQLTEHLGYLQEINEFLAMTL